MSSFRATRYILATAMVVTSIAADAKAAPDPKTAAAVLAADEGWGDAETRGDVAFVEHLLMPSYRSIGSNGKVTGRDAILAGVRARGGSPARAAEVAAWKEHHPTRGEVTMFGDTAVLTWISTAPANPGAVASCDIFVYRDGHWHAIYSQHSDA